MKTILVADDEFDVLSSLQTVLEDEGYRVIPCANGKEAIERIKEIKPDLVITDVMMPHLSGFEVLVQMKEIRDLKKTPSIVMSCIRPSVSQKSYDWQLFIQKPFSIDDLLAAVERIIGKADS